VPDAERKNRRYHRRLLQHRAGRCSVVSTLAAVPRALALLAAVVALAGCGGSGSSDSGDTKTLVVYVSAPFTVTPYVGDTIVRGAELGASTVNATGLSAGGTSYRVQVKRLDNELSPQAAVANVRTAVDADALAVVVDGTGVDASWEIANRAEMPVGIVYQGGIGLVDPDTRPNVFRIAPTDHGIAFRLAEYMIPKGLKVALITDDSGYGREGAKALNESFGENPEAVATKIEVPSSATDLAPQVLRARRSGATALLVWAQPVTIAGVITAARSAGWDVPIYAPPTAEDPLVRQELSDHPDWVDGLTFASGRMTAEVGPDPFLSFAASFEDSYGRQRVGVKTSEGKDVVQPPDYAMYAYDFVRLLAAAVTFAGSPEREGVLSALEQVTIRGANGDERGFNEENHEGVVDDDVYFARFKDMTFAPVTDDPLSASLPVIPQTS
jgi:branched-chain amino acid transport system substrate-binding protein